MIENVNRKQIVPATQSQKIEMFFKTWIDFVCICSVLFL